MNYPKHDCLKQKSYSSYSNEKSSTAKKTP